MSMEENDRDVVVEERQDESNRAIQAPGNLQVPAQQHRVTNFFIDNILRPDFGRRKTSESSLGADEATLSRHSSPTCAPPQGEPLPAEGTSTPHTVTTAKKPPVAAEEPLKARGESGGDQCLSSDSDSSQASSNPASSNQPMLWPAWVYCTRYSDRPSSGRCISLLYIPLSSLFALGVTWNTLVH